MSYIKEENDDEVSSAESSSESDDVSDDNSQDTAPEENPIDILEDKPNMKTAGKWSTLESDDACSDDNSQDSAPDEIPIDIIEEKPNLKTPDKWPTLEILPGGVIKPTTDEPEETDPKMCIYACAKCPQRFKELFSLTKHIRIHTDENRRKTGMDLCKLGKVERELLSLRRTRLQEERTYRKRKIEVMARIGSAMVNIDKEVFL